MVLDSTKSRDNLLRESLFEAGFDICHGPFSPKVYNDLLESEGLVEAGLLSKLPEEIEATDNEKNDSKHKVDAYLIGNTKHLWPIFLRWLHSENELKLQQVSSLDNTTNQKDGATTDEQKRTILIEDPLDTYEQTAIRDAVESVCPNGRNMLYWSSDYNPERMVSMARVASCTGFSYLDPQTHLSAHPTYGTWHSYRAVLLLAKEESSSSSEIPIELLPNPMSPVDQKAAKEAFDKALETSTGTTSEPNADASNNLDKEDRSKLSEELGKGNYDSSSENRKTRVSNAWITLRESITIGRETHRFDDHQLFYHYTKDPDWLIQGIKDLGIGIAP